VVGGKLSEHERQHWMRSTTPISTPTHTNNDEQTRMLPEAKTLFCRHF
jgi:hypothetical protein